MSDVLKLAAQRRDRLQKEVDRLNAFIALGETINREEKPLPEFKPGAQPSAGGTPAQGDRPAPQRLINNG